MHCPIMTVWLADWLTGSAVVDKPAELEVSGLCDDALALATILMSLPWDIFIYTVDNSWPLRLLGQSMELLTDAVSGSVRWNKQRTFWLVSIPLSPLQVTNSLLGLVDRRPTSCISDGCAVHLELWGAKFRRRHLSNVVVFGWCVFFSWGDCECGVLYNLVFALIHIMATNTFFHFVSPPPWTVHYAICWIFARLCLCVLPWR